MTDEQLIWAAIGAGVMLGCVIFGHLMAAICGGDDE